jgi:hypothetical protein
MMALFKVDTGLRQAEVANLRWEWEVEIPELETSTSSESDDEGASGEPSHGLPPWQSKANC